MIGYELPTSLNVGGVDFAIRTDFRAILDILIAQNDSELNEEEKAWAMLEILYEDSDSIPFANLTEACEKAVEFIDCGQKSDGKTQPKLVDWEQDAPLIIPAINKVAHTEIRSLSYLHWWTFISYYMEIGESIFSNVVSYRDKRAKHKKMEKYEKEFYKENKSLIDFKTHISEEEQKKKKNLEKWL